MILLAATLQHAFVKYTYTLAFRVWWRFDSVVCWVCANCARFSLTHHCFRITRTKPAFQSIHALSIEYYVVKLAVI